MWQETVEKLESLKDDEAAYRAYLNELFANFQNYNIPIDDYVKYREVHGMSQAIANNRWN
jgi:hypothetical protein